MSDLQDNAIQAGAEYLVKILNAIVDNEDEKYRATKEVIAPNEIQMFGTTYIRKDLLFER